MNKKFDCVEMKHKGAEKIRKKIRGLSVKDELKFWQNKSKELKNHKGNIIKRQEIMA